MLRLGSTHRFGEIQHLVHIQTCLVGGRHLQVIPRRSFSISLPQPLCPPHHHSPGYLSRGTVPPTAATVICPLDHRCLAIVQSRGSWSLHSRNTWPLLAFKGPEWPLYVPGTHRAKAHATPLHTLQGGCDLQHRS